MGDPAAVPVQGLDIHAPAALLPIDELAAVMHDDVICRDDELAERFLRRHRRVELLDHDPVLFDRDAHALHEVLVVIVLEHAIAVHDQEELQIDLVARHGV